MLFTVMFLSLAAVAPISTAALSAFVAAAVKAAVPLAVGFLAWLASGLLNWFMYWEENEDWTAWAAKNPHRAMLVQLVRMLGIQLRPLLTAWSAYMAALAKSKGVDPAVVNPQEPSKS